MVSSSFPAEYQDFGYLLVRETVSHNGIDQLLDHFLTRINEMTGLKFEDAHSIEVSAYLKDHKEVQGRVYKEIRRSSLLAQFSQLPGIVEPVRRLLGPDIALMRKIPFRIDVPLDTAEYAVWHQDHYYVRGNLDIITAWVPMQNTTYLNGCLAVMPGSQKLGPLEHDMVVLGKRHYPSAIFDRKVKYVEMRKGDMLLFHSCLLHSSSLNLSSAIRFSVQPRFTRVTQPIDPGMGGSIPVNP